MIKIQHGGTIFAPPIKEGATLERMKNGASVLNFTVTGQGIGLSGADGTLVVSEGDIVTVISDKLNPPGNTHYIFLGYVFLISPNRNGEIVIKAYDQLRYLQNKGSYTYEGQALSDVVRMICNDCNMKYGQHIVDTGYILPARIEDNKSYLDIIKNASDLTTEGTGNEFILWDDFGEIALVDRGFLTINLVIDGDTAQDFEFESSIDDASNQVKLIRMNNDSVRGASVQGDPDNISQWGLLERTRISMGGDTSQRQLTQYNKKTRSLSITGAFGDIRVRGGSMVYVQIDTADIGESMYGYTVSVWAQVESVTHTFNNSFHTMDLKLKGDEALG